MTRRPPLVAPAILRMLRRALPQACTLCAATSGDALICSRCANALPRLQLSSCDVCALPAAGSSVCGACLRRPPPFASTVAAFVYEFPVDRLVQELKYRGRLALAHWAAEELVAAVLQRLAGGCDLALPRCVIALPLSPKRQRERGFNQAHEIASRIASKLALPLSDSLLRLASSPPQAALPWSDRAANVRGAFACRGDVRGSRIALVDDVMTTGATLREAASTLRRSGAARVDCWVMARTLPPAR